MDLSKNRGFLPPKSSHFNRVWNHYFHHPFWGTTIFGNTHIWIDGWAEDAKKFAQNRRAFSRDCIQNPNIFTKKWWLLKMVLFQKAYLILNLSHQKLSTVESQKIHFSCRSLVKSRFNHLTPTKKSPGHHPNTSLRIWKHPPNETNKTNPLQPVDRHIPESTSPYLDQHYALPAPEAKPSSRAREWFLHGLIAGCGIYNQRRFNVIHRNICDFFFSNTFIQTSLHIENTSLSTFFSRPNVTKNWNSQASR